MKSFASERTMEATNFSFVSRFIYELYARGKVHDESAKEESSFFSNAKDPAHKVRCFSFY